MQEGTTTHLVGTTFPTALYGSLTTKKNDILHLVHEPYVHPSNPNVSDPNCIVVYRGENQEERVGCIPRGSEAQKYAVELCAKGPVEAVVDDIKYGVATPDVKEAVKRIQEGGEIRSTDSKMIQAFNATDTSYSEAIDDGNIFTFPICLMVRFGEKDVEAKIEKEDEHLDYEEDPKTKVMCRSITNFLSDPKVQPLYMDEKAIKSLAGFDKAIGQQKRLMLSLTANEGTMMHELASLAAFFAHRIDEPAKLESYLKSWDNYGDWAKLFCGMPCCLNSDLYIEDESKKDNTVFDPEMKLKGTADLFYVIKDPHGGMTLEIYDFKRAKSVTSKGPKDTTQYELQISFYAKKLAEEHKCNNYRAKIVLTAMNTDGKLPFKIVELDKDAIDNRFEQLKGMVAKVA